MQDSDPKLRQGVVVYPQGGALTQGTLFSCAVAENYAGCETCGLIITARCDAVKDKARCYNYVPVVTLNDWIHRDGRIILADRLMAETFGGLRRALTDAGFAASILETEEPRAILATLFQPDNTIPKLAKARDRFAELCGRYELALSGLLSAPSDAVCLRIAKVAPRMRDVLLTELVHQRLTAYYFLDRVGPDRMDTGHVALLREVQALPRILARAITRGLDAQQFVDMCGSQPGLRERLCLAPDELAMPIGLLCSPNLEHFMQSFSLLFSRIGIADPDPSYVDALWARQLSVTEVS